MQNESELSKVKIYYENPETYGLILQMVRRAKARKKGKK